MKELYDTIFDTVIALFILITIISSAVMMISSVVFTIQTGEHHSGITISSVVLCGLAMAVSYFYLGLITTRSTNEEK